MLETTVHDFVRRGQLVLCPLKDEKPLDRVLQDLTDILKGSDDKTPVRICVPELGSFAWGDLNSKVWSTQYYEVLAAALTISRMCFYS
jgi:hypothetical protein